MKTRTVFSIHFLKNEFPPNWAVAGICPPCDSLNEWVSLSVEKCPVSISWQGEIKDWLCAAGTLSPSWSDFMALAVWGLWSQPSFTCTGSWGCWEVRLWLIEAPSCSEWASLTRRDSSHGPVLGWSSFMGSGAQVPWWHLNQLSPAASPPYTYMKQLLSLGDHLDGHYEKRSAMKNILACLQLLFRGVEVKEGAKDNPRQLERIRHRQMNKKPNVLGMFLCFDSQIGQQLFIIYCKAFLSTHPWMKIQ